MPLIDRDFIQSYITAFFGALALVILITFVQTCLDLYQYIFSDEGSKLGYVVFYYLLTLPDQLTMFMLPLCGSASLLWVLAQKARTNEILAYLSCGVSPMRLARPFILIGALTSIGAFAMNETVGAEMLRRSVLVEQVNLKGRSQETVTRNRDILMKRANEFYYRVGSWDDLRKVMDKVEIVQATPSGSGVVWRLVADSAALEGEDKWLFRNARVWRYDEGGNTLEFIERAELRSAELDRPVSPRLEAFMSRNQNPDRMDLKELWQYVSLLDQEGKSNPKVKSGLHRKFAAPMATLLLVMLMCAHAIRPYHGGVVANFGGGLAWLGAFLVADMVFRKLGDEGALPAFLAAWLPVAAFGLGGVYLIKRTRFA